MASLSALSSEDLIKACLDSDNAAAWAEFIRRFQPLIARVVTRHARRQSPPAPSHVIDDLVQETYLRLCENGCRLLRQFRPRHQDSLYGFLKVVAACVVLDYFKGEHARKRDTGHTESLDDKSHRLASTGSRRALSAEDLVALRQIDSLLDKQYSGETLARNRAIFWFHYRDGMTAQAIASIPLIGLSTKGVETKLRRMTQLIQSHIESSS